jgi:predicted nuclease of predicted toxin-antitoxin system
MRLLFDEQLAASLVSRLSDLFPASAHVGAVNLASTDDNRIWEYAKANGCTIVTKDRDFENIAMVRGRPPIVIRLAIGNCSTREIEDLLRRNAVRIGDFIRTASRSLLIIAR